MKGTKAKPLKKLVKETRMVQGDSLNNDLRGAVIEEINKDWDNQIVVILLTDGRVLGIYSAGVMVFSNKQAYLEYAPQIIKELKEEDNKHIN